MMSNPPRQPTPELTACPGTRQSPEGRWFLVPVLVGACALGCCGCAYFRLGEKTITEEKQAQQEQDEINKLWFKPGTVFYSH